MNRCQACQVDPALECPAIHAPSLCGLAAGSPSYARAIADHAAQAAGATTPAPRPSVAESVVLVAAMKACQFRAVFPPCGCQGGRCGLRGGAIVSHLECFACLRTYDPPSEP